VNKTNALSSIKKNYGVSLDVAEQIVIKYNIPFRKVHKLIGQLVQYAISNKNIALDQIPQAEVNKILSSTQIKIDIDELMTTIKDIKPENSILLRKSLGSPNPTHQNGMIKSIQNSITIYDKVLRDRKDFLLTVSKNLDNAILNAIDNNNKC
jgi:argininosuccinate lyase